MIAETLTQLMAQEDFIEFGGCESISSNYKVCSSQGVRGHISQLCKTANKVDVSMQH